MKLEKVLETRKILKPIITFNDLPIKEKIAYFYKNYTENGIFKKILNHKIPNDYKLWKDVAHFLLENWKACDKSGLSESTRNIGTFKLYFSELGLLFQSQEIDENIESEENIIGRVEPDFDEDQLISMRFLPADEFDIFEEYLFISLIEKERDSITRDNCGTIPKIWARATFNLFSL